MIPAHFENYENVADQPPVHKKMTQFCWQILKIVDFENRTILKMAVCKNLKMITMEQFWAF